MAEEKIVSAAPEAEEQVQDINELKKIRIEKLEALQAAGKDPFEITLAEQSIHNAEIVERFEELENQDVSICGRMMSRRIMGKASFAHILDGEGKIQLYVARDGIGEEDYAAFKKWDVGDVIGVEGHLFRTRTGEVSVHVTSATLLAKSLLPLPENPDKITEEESELIILKVEEDDGEIYLCPIEDDDEFEEVGTIFEERLSELYDFEGNDEE